MKNDAHYKTLCKNVSRKFSAEQRAHAQAIVDKFEELRVLLGEASVPEFLDDTLLLLGYATEEAHLMAKERIKSNNTTNDTITQPPRTP